jgi:hypothetical protein
MAVLDLGCSTFTHDDLSTMSCQFVQLDAGDTLYLPAGLVHYAETDELEGSVHVTFRMQLPGYTALDQLYGRCLRLYPEAMCNQLRTQIQADATMFAWHRLYAGVWRGPTYQRMC